MVEIIIFHGHPMVWFPRSGRLDLWGYTYVERLALAEAFIEED